MGKLIKGKTQYYEGTDYMGRVLLSLNLIPHQRPEKAVTYLVGYNEPQTSEFILRVDLYELILPERQSKVWVSVKVGIHEQRSESPVIDRGHKKNKESGPLNQVVYKFEDKHVLLEEMSLHFPSDLKQVPDIFLNLYCKTTFGEKRLGYYRIKATDKTLQENSLDWFKFKGFGIGRLTTC